MGLKDKLKAGKPLTVREAERLLAVLGFEFSHAKGSHRHWVRGTEIFTLPVHGKDLKRWVTRELKKLYYASEENEI